MSPSRPSIAPTSSTRSAGRSRQRSSRSAAEVNEDDDVWALVITGAGRGFCSGVDLSRAPADRAAPGDPTERSTSSAGWAGRRSGVSGIAKPTIAAVNGVAAGSRHEPGPRLRPAHRRQPEPVPHVFCRAVAQPRLGDELLPPAHRRLLPGRRPHLHEPGRRGRGGLSARTARSAGRRRGGARRGARGRPTIASLPPARDPLGQAGAPAQHRRRPRATPSCTRRPGSATPAGPRTTSPRRSPASASGARRGSPARDRGGGPGRDRADPVTGGRHGWPFAASLDDLGAIGYVEEEYFLEGEANCVPATAEFGSDGRWAGRTRRLGPVPDPGPGAAAPRRLAVQRHRRRRVEQRHRRLRAPGRSAGPPRGGLRLCVRLGPAGRGERRRRAPEGLRAWDPERYGSLEHPGDRFSYAMFERGGPGLSAPAVRPAPPTPWVDSRSSGPWRSAPPSRRRGSPPTSTRSSRSTGVRRVPRADPLRQRRRARRRCGRSTPTRPRASSVFRTRTSLRDVGVPIMLVNSETETPAYTPSRGSPTPTGSASGRWPGRPTCRRPRWAGGRPRRRATG